MSSLVIWSTDIERRVAQCLSPVLTSDRELEVQFCEPTPADDDKRRDGVIYFNEGESPQVNGAKVVLGLGKAPCEWFAKNGIIPKNRTITSVRKQLWSGPLFPTPTLLSYSPGISDVDYGHYIDLLTDVSLAIRFARTGQLAPVLGQYRYVKDFSELLARVDALYDATGKPVAVSYDTETLGLDPYHPDAYLVSLQASCEAGTCDVIRFGSKAEMQAALSEGQPAHKTLKTLLTSPKIKLRCANGKYDINWTFYFTAIDCSDFTFDTMLGGSLLDENRNNDLGTHTKIYIPSMGGYSDVFDKVVDKSRMDLVSPERLLPYAGGDGDATLQVSKRMVTTLNKDTRLANFYTKLLHPAARAYEHVERTGVYVNKERYLDLESEVQTVMAKCVNEAKKMVGGKIIARQFARSKQVEKFNLTSPGFLTDYLFSPLGLNLKPQMYTAGSIASQDAAKKANDPKGGIKTAATSMEHLLCFKEHPEAKAFITLMKEYQSASKTLSTYIAARDKEGKIVKGFLFHLRSDGRFHPNFFLFKGSDDDEDDGGTNTGRTSAKDPAFQTLPSHTIWTEKLRRCYDAPPGYVVGSRDFEQGELRVMADQSGDATMLAAYLAGKDVHALTSGQLTGRTYEVMMEMRENSPHEYKELRQLAKAVNFGLIFLISAEGLQLYAANSYGVAMTIAEARAYHDGFFETYPGIREYHEAQKNKAKLHGQMRNPLGRVRHLPLINSSFREVVAKSLRQAVNAPIQSCLSDLTLLTTAVEHKQGRHLIAPCFGMVHDQLLNYVPEDNAEKWMRDARDIMENLPLGDFGWRPKLKFLVDASFGPNLADLKKVTR